VSGQASPQFDGTNLELWIALIGELAPVAQSDLLQILTLLKRRLDKHG
jgi:hypothetical protein